jgi:hypothetical protein
MKIEESKTVALCLRVFGHFISALWLPMIFGVIGCFVDGRDRFVFWFIAGFLCEICLELIVRERK